MEKLRISFFKNRICFTDFCKMLMEILQGGCSATAWKQNVML